jgi:hypothetical protein
MGHSIDQLLAEADQEINALTKKASKNEAVSNAGQPFSDDEPVKFAAFLSDIAEEEKEETKVAAIKAQPVIETPLEKVAHAFAIIETLGNIEHFHKLAEFQKKAEAAGYNKEQIDAFLEKQALRPLNLSPKTVKALKILGLGAGAGFAGEALGERKGETKGVEKGYVAGARDTSAAYENALAGYNE